MCPPTQCCCCELAQGVRTTSIVLLGFIILWFVLGLVSLLFLGPICEGHDEENLGLSWGSGHEKACTYTCCDPSASPWDNADADWGTLSFKARTSLNTSSAGCSNAFCTSPDGIGGYDCCAHKDWLEPKTCSDGKKPATTNPDLIKLCSNEGLAAVLMSLEGVFTLLLAVVYAVAICSIENLPRLASIWKLQLAAVASSFVLSVVRTIISTSNEGGLLIGIIPAIIWLAISGWWTAGVRALAQGKASTTTGAAVGADGQVVTGQVVAAPVVEDQLKIAPIMPTSPAATVALEQVNTTTVAP